MIRKKYHSTVAAFLLGCMLIVSVPFYDFLHQHHHFDNEVSAKSHQSQEVSAQTESIIAFDHCIACSISQLAKTFFVKSTDSFLILPTVKFSFIEKENKLVNLFTLTAQGRSPPVFIFFNISRMKADVVH